MAKNTAVKVLEAIEGAFLIAVCVILRPLMRLWYSKWGAAAEELTCKLPGDEYLSGKRVGYTQAISP